MTERWQRLIRTIARRHGVRSDETFPIIATTTRRVIAWYISGRGFTGRWPTS